MVSKKLLVFVFIFGALGIKAQDTTDSPDSLVLYSELTYNSPLEEQLIKNFLINEEKNLFGLFMAINSSIDSATYIRFKNDYEEVFSRIKSSKWQKKKPKNTIKFLYNAVHENFLRKYALQNDFSEIFSNGLYNCVSATALYGLLFNELEIPYVINETPTHVYLITYPNTQSIIVETTDPAGGYYLLNDRFKEEFVQNLRKSKLISEGEFRSTSINDIFNQYYFTEEAITLEKLIGLQYANDALYKMDKMEWKKAFYQLEKGYMFYPSEKIKFLLFTAGATVLDQNKYEGKEDLDFLVKLSRYTEMGITPENIAAEFSQITMDQLIDKYKPDLYTQSYDYLMSGIKDSTVRNEISWIYHYETGRVLYNKGSYSSSLAAIENAYALKPENVDIQAMLISAIINTLSTYNNTKEIIERLEKYTASYVNLLENNAFASVLANAYLIQFGQSYELNESKEGEKYRVLFEQMFNEIPKLSLETHNIGRAYSTAAVYYFKKGNSQKAKKILRDGLAISPNNYEITQRLNMIR